MKKQTALDTILLLAGAIEATALAGMLAVRRPRIDIRHVTSLGQIDKIGRAGLSRTRLIAFATDVIVPARILDSLGYGAYNFHPGPPNYPGWGPAHFAGYERANRFGATVHEMVERVDEGPIVGVETFAVPPGTSVSRLEQLAFAAMVRMFCDLAPALTAEPPLTVLPVSWSGSKSTKKQYSALLSVPTTISDDDLARRIAVFGNGTPGGELTITLHGHRFRYVAPAPETRTTALSMTHNMDALNRFALREAAR